MWLQKGKSSLLLSPLHFSVRWIISIYLKSSSPITYLPNSLSDFAMWWWCRDRFPMTTQNWWSIRTQFGQFRHRNVSAGGSNSYNNWILEREIGKYLASKPWQNMQLEKSEPFNNTSSTNKWTFSMIQWFWTLYWSVTLGLGFAEQSRSVGIWFPEQLNLLNRLQLIIVAMSAVYIRLSVTVQCTALQLYSIELSTYLCNVSHFLHTRAFTIKNLLRYYAKQ